MATRRFNIVCDFYPQSILLELPTAPHVLTTNDVVNRVRAVIIASGDVPPPASQLQLRLVLPHMDGAGEQQTVALAESVITLRGLESILADYQLSEEDLPAFHLHKKPESLSLQALHHIQRHQPTYAALFIIGLFCYIWIMHAWEVGTQDGESVWRWKTWGIAFRSATRDGASAAFGNAVNGEWHGLLRGRD